MTVRKVAAAFCAALVVEMLSVGTAHADTAVEVKSRLGDYCMDAPSANWLSPIVINSCNGTDYQRWTLTDFGRLESAAFPGQCLNVQNLSSSLTFCGNAQRWAVQDNGQITAILGGCLTVLGDPGPGTWVATRICNGSPGQGWDVIPV